MWLKGDEFELGGGDEGRREDTLGFLSWTITNQE